MLNKLVVITTYRFPPNELICISNVLQILAYYELLYISLKMFLSFADEKDEKTTDDLKRDSGL